MKLGRQIENNMVTIYRDYADEPDPVFLPLPEELACDLYRLEMEDFQEDIAFYRQLLPDGGRILEVGCGTGRVARQLAGRDREVVGMDISMPMLRRAALHHPAHCRFLCMDMVHLGFRQAFDAVLIPYNTLNLLTDEDRILRCLGGCRRALKSAGQLVVQLFVPAPSTQAKTTFQFQMFDRPGGGRIIKEILKRPQPESQTMEIEERFRVRPMRQGQANTDYRSIYRVTTLPIDRWLSLFAEAGFSPEHIWGSYDRKAYDPAVSSCCLLQLKRNL